MLDIKNIIESCIKSISEENEELFKYSMNNAPLSQSESKTINKRLDQLEEILEGVKLLVYDVNCNNQVLVKKEKNTGITEEEYHNFLKRINGDY